MGLLASAPAFCWCRGRDLYFELGSLTWRIGSSSEGHRWSQSPPPLLSNLQSPPSPTLSNCPEREQCQGPTNSLPAGPAFLPWSWQQLFSFYSIIRVNWGRGRWLLGTGPPPIEPHTVTHTHHISCHHYKIKCASISI